MQHADRAVRATLDGVDQVVLNLFRDERGRQLGRALSREADVALHALVLCAVERLVLADELLHVGHTVGGHRDDSRDFARDGVAERAALDRGQAHVVVADGLLEEAEEELVGVGAAQVDVDTRVAALESGQGEAQRHVALRRRLAVAIVEGDVHVHPAGAAYEEAPLLFGVAVDHDRALQEAGLEAHGAVHAHLLVDREEALQGAVLDRLVGQGGHGQRDAHAVVRAEGRVARRDPLAVDVGVDRVAEEVVRYAGVLLRHHVDVRLQHDRLPPLVARRGGFADEHIAHLILVRLQAMLLSEGLEVIRYLFRVTRRTRDLCEVVEITPDGFRGQSLDFFCHDFESNYNGYWVGK